jgi:hypothetical protein
MNVLHRRARECKVVFLTNQPGNPNGIPMVYMCGVHGHLQLRDAMRPNFKFVAISPWFPCCLTRICDAQGFSVCKSARLETLTVYSNWLDKSCPNGARKVILDCLCKCVRVRSRFMPAMWSIKADKGLYHHGAIIIISQAQCT